jgi:hypothetical protein
MSRGGDYLDLRRWRNVVSYLAGIGVEAAFILVLAGIAVLVLAVFWIVRR